MATGTHATSVHPKRLASVATGRVSAKALLVCALSTGLSFASAAFAQDATKPEASTAVTNAPATRAAPVHRKRSAFGEAMSQLTQALSDASKQAASPPAGTTADTTAPTQPATAAVDRGALAVESPP